MGFGSTIKRLRERSGMSTREVASVLGVDPERLRKWEQKDFNPRSEDRLRIEAVLGFDLSQLEHLEKFPNVPKGTTYIEKRIELKNSEENEKIPYYDVSASAGTAHEAEILPVKKSEGLLHINDLFKGSQYAIKISGNSMTPHYPSGAIIGIREIPDKVITPGSVYVIEKDSDLWIKRLYYKDDKQETGVFVCISDNTIKQEKEPREGKLYYPPFEIEIDSVRKLFKVIGIYKSNDLTVIN